MPRDPEDISSNPEPSPVAGIPKSGATADNAGSQKRLDTRLDCSTESAVQKLYQEMAPALVVRLRRLLRRDDLAHEIVQETFLKLWSVAPKFDHPKAAYKWLYRTSNNLAIDHLRRHATKHETSWLDSESPRQSPEDQISGCQLLDKVLNRVSAEEAQIIALRLLDRMTLAEISEVVKISKRTLSRRWKKIERHLATASEQLKEGL